VAGRLAGKPRTFYASCAPNRFRAAGGARRASPQVLGVHPARLARRGYALAMRHRLPALAVLASMLLAACGGSASPAATATAAPAASSAAEASVIPIIVSSQQVVGTNRFVFSFLDKTGNVPVAAPDRTASVGFIAPGDAAPGPSTKATFVWAIEGSRGDYVATAAFPVAGDWKAVFTTAAPGSPEESIGVGFQVQEQGVTVGVGMKAPSVATPTAADVGGDLARIATDPSPDPAFYQLSIADALARHKPFVVVFATPAFCVSAQCGPTLDRVKAVATTSPPDVVFINVEPYQLQFSGGRLQPVLDANGQLQPVDAVNQWKLLSEPWIFTVDANGIIQGSFEGVVGVDELTAAIAKIAGS